MTAAKKKPPLYKITGPNGEPINGGSGLWHLPTKGKPGKWMSKLDHVEACRSGYHLVTAIGIVDWLPHAPQTGVLWLAEGRGASDGDGSKTAFAQARLVKKIGILDEVSMRLAAADIAERVLPLFLKHRPNDDRPAKAIQAARDFAHGKIDAAAWAAASAAASDAARAAASDAASAAAWAAASDAASAAAWAAASDAARAAAWAAASDAARAAAWDANAKIIIAQSKRRLADVTR